MSNLLLTLLLISELPASSLRDTVDMSLREVEAAVFDPDSLEVKQELFMNNEGCRAYQEYQYQIVSIPCKTLQKVLDRVKKSLITQGSLVAFEVLCFGFLTAVGAVTDLGEFLSTATSPENAIPASMTVGELLGKASENKVSKSHVKIAQECCGCDMVAMECIRDQCYKDAITLYNKVSQMHSGLKKAANISGKVALGAAVTGLAIDVISGGSTMGAASVVASNVAMVGTVAKSAMHVGHLTVSCNQHGDLKQCWQHLCPPQGD